MAKTQKDLKGWEFELQEVNQEGGRRSRRNKPADDLSLKRSEDQLTVKKGDTLLVQLTNSTQIGLVKDIQFGTIQFIDLVVIWFQKADTFEETASPNEICLTAYVDEIHLVDILDKVQVVSHREFQNDVEIDDSVSSKIFFCRKGSDQYGNMFTEEFDYRELMQSHLQNFNLLIEFIKEGTIPRAYKKKPVVKAESEAKIVKSPTKGKIIKKETNPFVDVSSEDSDASIAGEVTSESDDVFSDNEVVPSKKKTRKTSQKALPTRSSPARIKRPKIGSESQFPDDSPGPLDASSRETLNTMLSPLKRRLRLKQEISKPTIRLSPQKKKVLTSTTGPTMIDSTSEAFKQLKAKLHTSAKLASLPCREDEFISLYLNLESAIQEESGCCLYVSGTPGVGKTATVREVVAELQSLVQLNELAEFDYLEINGLKLINPQVSYELLWEKVSGLKVSASNSAVLLESYFLQEDANRKPLVVLLDELDQIVTKKQNVMYNFFNWPTYATSKLIVIAVANTMDLPERILSNKISSRLGLRRIQFIGYSYEQLGIIIKHRLQMVQTEKKVVVNSDAVEFASRKVASVSGDARRALTICRRAVEIAEGEFRETFGKNSDQVFQVQIKHIMKAINETINSPILQYLMALPFTHKLLLIGLLLRMKREGKSENTIGDVVKEMKNFLSINDRYFTTAGQSYRILLVIYDGLLPSQTSLGDDNIRALNFNQAIHELTEGGIILQQNIKSERYRLISLNISEEEVLTALKNDQEVGLIFKL